MTKKQYTPEEMILPCDLRKGHIIEHEGTEKVVSKTIPANNAGATTYVYFEGQKGYVEYSNSVKRAILGHDEKSVKIEKDTYVNFEDRRHALLCAANFYAQKSYVDGSTITELAEEFEQWLKR